jgi:hypothetical protein
MLIEKAFFLLFGSRHKLIVEIEHTKKRTMSIHHCSHTIIIERTLKFRNFSISALKSDVFMFYAMLKNPQRHDWYAIQFN